jgi:hypothetical protein
MGEDVQLWSRQTPRGGMAVSCCGCIRKERTGKVVPNPGDTASGKNMVFLHDLNPAGAQFRYSSRDPRLTPHKKAAGSKCPQPSR